MQNGKTRAKIDMAKYANVADIARACGRSTRWVQLLFKNNNAKGKVDRGKYDINIFFPWLIDFLDKGQRTEEQISSKERKEKIQADRAELNFLKEIGELVPNTLSGEIIIEELILIAKNIYGISNKVAIKMLQTQTKEEVKNILNNEFNIAFQKYSDQIKPKAKIDRASNTKKTTRRKKTNIKKKSTRRTTTKTKIANKRVGKKV